MERSAYGIDDEGAMMSIALESGTTGNPTADGISAANGRFNADAGAAAGFATAKAQSAVILARSAAEKIAKVPTPWETAEQYFKRTVGAGAFAVGAAIVLGGLALWFLVKHGPSVAKVTGEATKGAKGFAGAITGGGVP